MTGLRILHGLDRLPGSIAADDPRLPSTGVSTAPLRLNSQPLPADAWPADEIGHATRMAAMRAWLLAGCGDYNGALRRCVTRYLDAIETHVARHRDGLASGLARFQGLYTADDWCWSALRPLPRAWWLQDGAWMRADLAFWDGNSVIAMGARDFDTGELPVPFQKFWIGETLPISPFRRAFPSGTGIVSLRPSFP
jgi:hypothetical protein